MSATQISEHNSGRAPAGADSDRMKLVELEVSGMSCGSCAMRVKRALSRQPGVADATVDYATGRATVSLVAGSIDPGRLIAAVENAGYRASPVGTNAAEQALSFAAHELEESRERAALARRIAVAVPLAVAVAALTYASPHDSTTRWITAALAVPVQFWCGLPFLRSAWSRARRRGMNADTLIALGTLTTFVYSIVMLIAQTHGYQHGVPVGQFEMSLDYDFGAAIITVLLIARWFESRARSRAGRDRRETARLGEIQAGRPDAKPQVQRVSDRVAVAFVPFVVALAAVTALVWVLTGQGDHGMFASLHLERAIDATIAVLIVASPSALGLAIPVAMLAGTARGANLGLLIRGRSTIGRSQRLDTIVLEGSHTVTTGELSVAEVWAAPSEDPDALLALAAAVERGCEHPVAVAIVAAARERDLALPAVEDAHPTPGRGARARKDGMDVWVGRTTSHAGSAEAAAVLESWEQAGRTVIALERGTAIIGAVALAEAIRPEAKDAVAGLRRMGLDVRLISGENERAAHAVASALGIESVQAELDPTARLEQIAHLQHEGRRVGLVADGVEDAAALARADLGIAIGTSAGLAIEAADISVLSDDLRGVPRALRLARETHTIVLQNLAFALGYNLIALPLAVTGLLNPALAAVATGLASIAVIANSLRLRRFGRQGQPTPVRGPFTRRVSIAVATVVPVLLLGGLVLGAPDTFAVPSSATHIFTASSGATLEVEATPLTASEVGVHLYLYDATNAQNSAGRIPISATSSSGQRAMGTAYTIAPNHDFGAILLRTGVWDLHISVTDSAGQRLGGSFAVPVNVTGASVDTTATLKPGTRPPAPASARARTSSPPAATGQVIGARVSSGQLSVADELGPDIVAAWVTHVRGHLSLQLHTLTAFEEATAIPISLAHATIVGSCGPGCDNVLLAGSASTLVVHAVIDGVAYTARLPVAFDAAGDQRAVALLRRVDAAQVKLHSAVADETLASSPAAVEATDYRIQAPNRFSYKVAVNGKLTDDTIIIGTREWDRALGKAWQPGSFGTQPFSAAGYFDWWADYADAPRLLDLDRAGGTTIADIATVAELPGLGPVWLRLHIDATHDRMLYVRMITVAHFMTESWSSFNAAGSIAAPVQARPGATG